MYCALFLDLNIDSNANSMPNQCLIIIVITYKFKYILYNFLNYLINLFKICVNI